MRVKGVLAHLLLLGASVVLFSGALPGGVEVPWFAWVVFVPVFFVLEKIGVRRAFFYGFFFGTLFYGVQMWWLRSLEYFPLTSWISASLFYGFIHVPWVFAAIVLFRKVHPRFYLFYAASLWVFGDWLIRETIFALPFFNIAESQYRFLNFLQIADLAGIHGISFIMLLGNVCVFVILSNLKGIGRASKIGYAVVALFFVLLAGSFVYGAWRMKSGEGAPPEEVSGIRVLAVQPNFYHGEPSLQDPEVRMSTLIRMTEEAVRGSKEKLDLIVWPEVALNHFLFEAEKGGPVKALDSDRVTQITELSKKLDTPLLLGSYSRIADTPIYRNRFGRFYNSMALFSPDGSTEAYHKNRPLWAAEYFPDFMGFIKEYANERGYGLKTPADRLITFSTGSYSFGALICSENGLGAMSRTHVARGADFLINPADDSSFRSDAVIRQHEVLNIFRAIENRVPVLGVGNVGGTQLIDKTGKIERRLDHWTQGVLLASINIPDVPLRTTFNRFGHLFPLFLGVVCFTQLFVRLVRRRFLHSVAP